MLTKPLIYEEIVKALNTILSTSQAYSCDTKLLGEGHLIDSLDVLRLVAWCDDCYSIHLLEEDYHLEGLQSIGTMVEAVWRKKNSSE